MVPYWLPLKCDIRFTHKKDVEMKERRCITEKRSADLTARIMFHILQLESIYKTLRSEYIFRDVSKASAKLVTSQNKQMSLAESWFSFHPCFMIEQLTCSLSQRACVRTNKEADCCCPLWFILLFCPPSAPDKKLIKTLSCLLTPSQTAGANHVPPFTAFYYFTMNGTRTEVKMGSTKAQHFCFFQIELKPHCKM